MKLTNGLFVEGKNNEILIYDPKRQQKVQITLHKPWNYFPFNIVNYLTPIRAINLFFIDNSKYETTPDTLILINPDILISSRVIAGASVCPRRTFIEFITGESKPNRAMIRGSIIHHAFSAIVSKNKTVSDALEEGIEKYAFQLSYLSTNLKELTSDISSVLRGLAQSAPTLQENNTVPEMTFLSPLYGIRGRLDYWSPKELYELKTGRKIPEANTWFSDLMQTVIYMHGLSSTPKAVSRSSVIYSGEGTPAFRQTTINLDLLQRIHMARNYCYLIQFESYVPPETETKFCSHCFTRDLCTSISNILNEHKSSSSKVYQYFDHFLSLNKLEHLKNRQDFASLWKLSSQGRIKTGKAIKKIKLMKREGETHHYSCHNLSELRPGEPVILSKGNPIVDVSNMATIVSIERNRISLSSQNDLPSNAYLDAYSSDFSFRRLNKNLYDIAFGLKCQHKAHKLVIFGNKPTFSLLESYKWKGLDESQQKAVQLALSANDFCLIQGPAGTGKTYTIVKLIQILRKRGQSILLSAYTNTAVDNIIRQYIKLTKDNDAFKEIVRLGVEQAMSPEVVKFSLQQKKLKYLDLLKTPIIAATTSTISRSLYDDLNFDTVIIDEASQMAEPFVLSAITKGSRFILVGDDKQLPPLIQSNQAEKLGLGTSLFERLRKLHPEASVLLKYQYRMHENLMDFSNRSFYDNCVQAATHNVATQLLWDLLPENTEEISDPLYQVILDPNQPLVYVEVSSDFDQKRRVNVREAEVINIVVQFYLQIGLLTDHMGIIAPFRGQVAEIFRNIGINSGITVDTIDRFQGSDKELIILSLCTLSRPHILEDERRLNVALTRAKKKLIIIGNCPTKQSIPLFRDLYTFIKQNYSLVRLASPETYPKTIKKTIKEQSIEVDFSFQSLSPDDINKEYAQKINHNICVLCLESVENKKRLRCPICNQAYHGNHLREWLENHDTCVTCQSRIQLT
ncbi:MAG: AAA domain-containing protein [Candidatus Hodarchaeota archaeon]